MINGLVVELLDVSGIGKKEDLVSVAANLKNQIKMDPKMLGILNAISVGDLDDSEWIVYIAMVLTDMSPTDWTDQDRLQFSTNLAEFAAKFKRVLAIHVDKIKKSSSVLHRITITENTGQEYMKYHAMKERQYSWSPGETLPELLNRRSEIEEKHKNALLKAKSSRKNLPLMDVLSEALDDEDDTKPCTMCHL